MIQNRGLDELALHICTISFFFFIFFLHHDDWRIYSLGDRTPYLLASCLFIQRCLSSGGKWTERMARKGTDYGLVRRGWDGVWRCMFILCLARCNISVSAGLKSESFPERD